MTPRTPKPGDLVMFETSAEPWAQAAQISAFGKDVRMFRVGDRFRAYVAVPLTAKPTAAPIAIWMGTPSDPDGHAYQCLDTLVAPRPKSESESLKVARKFTKHLAPKPTEEPNSAWVQPLDKSPFSLSLFTWPGAGEITSRFNVGRVYNAKLTTRHMGLDLAGTIGDRIFATQAGVVRYVGKQKSTGLTVAVDHGGGVLSFYMHLSQARKRVGDKVSQGEPIAHIGRSGRVTGPHLHFAMSVHGRFVDPEQVLAHPLYAAEAGASCRATFSSSAR